MLNRQLDQYLRASFSGDAVSLLDAVAHRLEKSVSEIAEQVSGERQKTKSSEVEVQDVKQVLGWLIQAVEQSKMPPAHRDRLVATLKVCMNGGG